MQVLEALERNPTMGGRLGDDLKGVPSRWGHVLFVKAILEVTGLTDGLTQSGGRV